MRISRGLVAGYGSLVMENPAVRVVILPELGGRVWELWDLERGRQWIWHREGVPPCVAGPGSSYDEVWAGGW
ncbi:MAG TPA: hypothetical protein VI383_03270, partial [Gemmatimonadales bacterium]|nr:hypothetical protein [Gemmatimonadales bacterium]